MEKINWSMVVAKLSSRKLWAAVAAFVTGLLVHIGATAQSAESIGSLIMMGGAVVAYLLAEGLVDCARGRGQPPAGDDD